MKENKNSYIVNKENRADEYKLFTNIIKLKEESSKIVISKNSKQEPVGLGYAKNEYFDILNI